MSAIEIRHLTRRYGKVEAVHDLNLSIAKGSLFGLIGPNGAGKTTTLRMLAGLLEPSSGEILVAGELVRSDRSGLQHGIGYMPDFFGVYEDLLVWEYLDFFARCYDMPAARRKQVVDELLELVDLADKRDAYVQTLSRGMSQRLCLAHALVHDPDVLLLDEPASGLDPRARVEMRELLRELGAMGKTIILSSHILAELAELCDSIAIIEKGRLVASGLLAEIRSQVQSGKRIRVRVLAQVEEAAQVLSAYDGVSRVFTPTENGSAGMLEFDFSGDDEASAALLGYMVSHKIQPYAFEEIHTGLEELFLKLTKGEVA